MSVSGSHYEPFSQGLDSEEGVVMFAALVAALVARVTPCECFEFQLDGVNIINAVKVATTRSALALSSSDFMLRAR